MLFLSRDPCHRVLAASFKLFFLYFFANLKIASQDNAKESSFCSPQTTFAVVQLFPFRTEWNTRLYEANLDCLDDFRKKHRHIKLIIGKYVSLLTYFVYIFCLIANDIVCGVFCRNVGFFFILGIFFI